MEEKKGRIRWWLIIILTLVYFLILITFTIPIGVAAFEYKFSLYHDALDALMTGFIICAIFGTMMGTTFLHLLNRINLRKPMKGGMKDEKWKNSKDMKKRKTTRRRIRR